MVNRKKRKNWFKSSFIVLLVTFGVFGVGLLLFYNPVPLSNWGVLVNSIFGYGTGITGTAIGLYLIGFIFPKIRKQMIKV